MVMSDGPVENGIHGGGHKIGWWPLAEEIECGDQVGRSMTVVDLLRGGLLGELVAPSLVDDRPR
jgi:hypothetical protein